MQFTFIIKGFALLATSSMVFSATLSADVSIQRRSMDGYSEFSLLPVVRDDSAHLTPRAAAGIPTGLFCIPVPGQTWNRAWYTDIMNGVAYLHAINRPIPVAAHACGRISCSYNSGIYVCNDNDYPINVDSNHFADMAEQVANQCYVVIPHSSPMTGGQIFDSDGYNIIVHDDLC